MDLILKFHIKPWLMLWQNLLPLIFKNKKYFITLNTKTLFRELPLCVMSYNNIIWTGYLKMGIELDLLLVDLWRELERIFGMINDLKHFINFQRLNCISVKSSTISTYPELEVGHRAVKVGSCLVLILQIISNLNHKEIRRITKSKLIHWQYGQRHVWYNERGGVVVMVPVIFWVETWMIPHWNQYNSGNNNKYVIRRHNQGLEKKER